MALQELLDDFEGSPISTTPVFSGIVPRPSNRSGYESLTSPGETTTEAETDTERTEGVGDLGMIPLVVFA